MEIKLVAIDLDDTLLKNDLTISNRAKVAIQNCIAQGTMVTFATGRMYKSALPYAQELGLNLPLITYQGALVKYTDGKEVYHRPLELSLAKEILGFLKSTDIHVNVYVNDELIMEKITEHGKRYAAMVKVPIHTIKLPEELRNSPTKILLIADSEELKKLEDKLHLMFMEKINLTKSKKHFLEISHPLATKGQALRELAESLGLTSEEVMAIGDNLNDLDMLQYAGIGVAVGNAEEKVKKIASYITLSNNDDGVADVLEKLVIKCRK